MFCGNCGKKFESNEQFCSNCGYKRETIQVGGYGMNGNVQPNQPIQPVKKSGAVGCAIVGVVAFLILVVGFIVFVFAIVFTVLNEMKTQEYVNLGDDEIPTIYKIFDEEMNICSVSTSTSGKEVKYKHGYCTSVNEKYFDEYFDYLIEEEDFMELTTYGTRVIGKESVDDGYIIEIRIQSYETLVFEKKKGTYEDDYVDSI